MLRLQGIGYFTRFILLQEFRACGRDKGTMETDEVRDRPLETFACTPMLVVFSVTVDTGDSVGKLWINTRA